MHGPFGPTRDEWPESVLAVGTAAQVDTTARNVSTVKRLYELFAMHDVDSILAVLDDDVVWAEPENPWNPAGGTRHGHAGFLGWVTAGRDCEEILVLDVHQFIGSGDVVAVIGRSTCRVKATGRMYSTDFVHLVTIRDGKIARFQEFFDTFAAAEAFRPQKSWDPARR